MYFENLNKKVIIHTIDEKIEYYGKLEEVIKRVNKKYFWRIHKSFIINNLNAKKIEYRSVVMNNDEILHISQKYRVDVRNRQSDLLENK